MEDTCENVAGPLQGGAGDRDDRKIHSSDNKNGLLQQSDGVVVEIERFSHPAASTDKEMNANSRPTLQRNLSRKGSAKGGEKKMNSILAANDRDACLLSTSPRASLHGSSMPEKQLVMATDHSTLPPAHHQITIINGGGSNAAAESKSLSKKFSFRQRSASLPVDPRRILLFFATLSSVGTILLIYFTLSMSKMNGDGAALN